ncbi:hypothetical protein HG531_002665 [Fusarium graminearum]|nr:hypothetical protein HG531_002665 [Fusarium graminearum]
MGPGEFATAGLGVDVDATLVAVEGAENLLKALDGIDGLDGKAITFLISRRDFVLLCSAASSSSWDSVIPSTSVGVRMFDMIENPVKVPEQGSKLQTLVVQAAEKGIGVSPVAPISGQTLEITSNSEHVGPVFFRVGSWSSQTFVNAEVLFRHGSPRIPLEECLLNLIASLEALIIFSFVPENVPSKLQLMCVLLVLRRPDALFGFRGQRKVWFGDDSDRPLSLRVDNLCLFES